jgi:hypothetical protein
MTGLGLAKFWHIPLVKIAAHTNYAKVRIVTIHHKFLHFSYKRFLCMEVPDGTKTPQAYFLRLILGGKNI